MNKLFVKRTTAFLIDILLLYLLSTVVTIFVPTFGNMKEYYNEMNEIMDDITDESVQNDKFLERIDDITYKVMKATYLHQVATITIYILYFVVYQKKKGGQTFGKKKMNIRIRKQDNSELRYDDLLKRGALLYGFLINIIMLGVLLFASKKVYFIVDNILIYAQYAIFVACLLMTIVTGVGLHDKFANTIVEEY